MESTNSENESQKTAFPKEKILPIVAVLIGILLAGSVGYFLGNNNTNASDKCEPPIQNLPNQNFLSEDEIKQKLTDYFNNFFSAQGIKINILSLEKFSNELYKVKFELKRNNEKLEEGEFYAMKDGKTAFLAMIDLTKKPQQNQQQTQEQQKQEFKKTSKPKVELYVMSFCPFGKQAEKGMLPVLKLLKDKIDFRLHFIYYKNYCNSMLSYYSQNLTDEEFEQKTGKTKEQWLEDCKKDFCIENTDYCSMHGIKEAEEDLRQKCIFNKSIDEWIKYVEYFNENCSMQNLDTCWKEALSKTSIKEEDIQNCMQNTTALLEEDFNATSANNVSGSPTLIINGSYYQGQRTPQAYKEAICSAFTEKPEECNKELSNEGSAAEGQC